MILRDTVKGKWYQKVSICLELYWYMKVSSNPTDQNSGSIDMPFKYCLISME